MWYYHHHRCSCWSTTAALVISNIILLSLSSQTANALFADDVGLFDFHIATAGHGPVTSVFAIPSESSSSSDTDESSEVLILTSSMEAVFPTRDDSNIHISEHGRNDQQAPGGAGALQRARCYMACRTMSTGALVWRRNVCRRSTLDDIESRTLEMTVIGTTVVTLEAFHDKEENANANAATAAMKKKRGILRGWNGHTGALIWDRAVVALEAMTQPWKLVVAQDDDDDDNKHAAKQQWRVMVAIGEPPEANRKDRRRLVASARLQSGTSSTPSSSSSSVQWETVSGTSTVESTMSSSSSVQHTKSTLLSREVTCRGATIQLTSVDDDTLATSATTTTTTTTTTGRAVLRLQNGTNDPILLSLKDHSRRQGVDVAPITIDAMALIQCTATKATIVTTMYQRGSTQLITIDMAEALEHDSALGSMTGTAQIAWSQLEGLALISSALQMDASHSEQIVATAAQKDSSATAVPSLENWSTRWKFQWDGLVRGLYAGAAVLTKDTEAVATAHLSRRDSIFGFGKIAILLSSACHVVYGVETFTANRKDQVDRVRYQVPLPIDAQWHSLVHGSNNRNTALKHANDAARQSRSSGRGATAGTATTTTLGGVQGGAYTRDVLILSYIPPKDGSTRASMQWICMDGTNGVERAIGSRELPPLSIMQIVPLTTGSSANTCRQGALLLMKDGSIVTVTGGEVVATTATTGSPMTTDETTSSDTASNNSVLYTHVLERPSVSSNRGGSRLVSYAISPGLQEAHVVGLTLFAGEGIVSVGYPSREEVVHSPCDILGDDSLLLKYLNPHLAVVLTMTTDEAPTTEEFNLQTKSTLPTQKRKPAGASQPGQSTETDSAALKLEKSNLFVNVIDTVSGRILHRTSHTNVALDYPRPTVLVSENWVFYTFVNHKTRKAELGVMSLYEGMIGKTGLTAFASPEQLSSFSSLDARETKPVVLTKTFSIPMAIAALGMTATRSGISGRQLVLSSVEGQIHAIDRKMLEPRRPLGALKPHEKKEGLTQYHELIPKISYNTLSYNRTVEGVHSIVAAPTDLESQSLILAYGGPDIFFIRMSPSKAFDLLPDNFNKIVLTLVVAALIGALIVMQVLVAKKVKNAGWV